jgi:hypothetical protein
MAAAGGGEAVEPSPQGASSLYATMSLGEGKVMGCAWIIDKVGDIALVRKAAAYLEEVEVHRGRKLF